jgi:uncharacterized protein with von Willebrand factor type A (vWA) domain
LDQKKNVELYLHVDKKVDDVKHQLGAVREVEMEIKKTLERLEQRVDNGVSRTGQDNKTTLAEHSMKFVELHHTLTNISAAVKEVSERTNLIYKGILGIFFTVLLGGFVGFVVKELPSWFR